MSQAQHVCACCVYAGPLARDRRRGSITRLYTHTQRDGLGSAQAPGTVHSGPWDQGRVRAGGYTNLARQAMEGWNLGRV